MSGNNPNAPRGKTDPRKPLDYLPLPTWASAPQPYVKGGNEPSAVHPSDVIQGSQADCHLAAAMAAIAQQHPDPDRWIREVIKDNGDGTYTVTFYEPSGTRGYKARPVTIKPDRTTIPGNMASDDPNETWPRLIEKAYAKAYGSVAPEGYRIKDGGVPGQVLEQLTRKPTVSRPSSDVSIDVVADYHAKGFAIVMPTRNDPTGGADPLQVGNWHPAFKQNLYGEQLLQWHSYYVSAVDRDTGVVTIHDPNSMPRTDIRVPFEEFRFLFPEIQVNPLR